jgi:hypothetical protein
VDALGDSDGHRERPQPVGDPSRPDRLLTQASRVERDPFVLRATSGASDTHGGEDEIGSVEGLIQIGRRGHAKRPMAKALLSEGRRHDIEAALVDVMEDEVIDPLGTFVGKQ